MRASRLRTAVVVGLTVVVGLPSAAPASSAVSGVFVDDDGIPAEQAFEWLAERGVLHGCDPPANQRVCPDDVLTRAQAAKVLVLLGRREGVLAEERPGKVDHFLDDGELWEGVAQEFIGHLADEEIVHGCDPPANRRFCPGRELLRGQIAKMIVRTFDLEAPAAYRSPWSDTDNGFFHEAARVAAFHRLWDSSAGTFEGWEVVSRAEFAQAVVAAVEPDLCDDDPFTATREENLSLRHPPVAVTAYAFDLDTRCAYWMNPDSRQRTASVFKVMVMAGTLLEAQAEDRPLTPTEMSLLEPMITQSANQPVRDLWEAFGGDPWFTAQAEIFGLDQTQVVGDRQEGPWGRTTTSARDQANLLRQILVGEWGPLDAGSRTIATDLMTSVTPTQTWGVTAGVPADWTVAQKNGFAATVANSVGVVYGPEGDPNYVLVILTQGWPTWEQGVPTVEEISTWVADSLLASPPP